VTYDGSAPETGATVTADGKAIGTMGSAAGQHGLAMLRLDRAEEARGAGLPLTADETEIRIVKPSWARFAVPGETKAAE
jgi:hypothetical protein